LAGAIRDFVQKRFELRSAIATTLYGKNSTHV
jgi:hypothetical protein